MAIAVFVEEEKGLINKLFRKSDPYLSTEVGVVTPNSVVTTVMYFMVHVDPELKPEIHSIITQTPDISLGTCATVRSRRFQGKWGRSPMHCW